MSESTIDDSSVTADRSVADDMACDVCREYLATADCWVQYDVRKDTSSKAYDARFTGSFSICSGCLFKLPRDFAAKATCSEPTDPDTADLEVRPPPPYVVGSEALGTDCDNCGSTDRLCLSYQIGNREIVICEVCAGEIGALLMRHATGSAPG